MSVPTARAIEHQKIALQYLQISRWAYQDSKRQRVYWIGLARKYGLSWAAIGSALGISDTAARRLYERSVERG